MATQRPQLKKKATAKNEYAKKTKDKTPKSHKGIVGEVQAVLFFALSVMVLVALITFDVNDSGVSSSNINGVIHNALGRGGALFSSFIVHTFGGASFILPVLLFGFGILRLRGQSVSIYKLFGIFFVLVLLSLLSATTNFIVKEEKAGGVIGSFLYESMSSWVGSTGVAITLLCFIPIATKLLFNISLLQGVFTLVKGVTTLFSNAFRYALSSLQHIFFKRRMARIYTKSVEEESIHRDMEDTSVVNRKPKNRFSLKSSLTRYLGIKMEDTKSEEVFDDLMGLSRYGAEHETDPPISDKENDFIDLPIYKAEEKPIELHLAQSYSAPSTAEQKQSIKEQEYLSNASVVEEDVVLPNAGLLGSVPKNTLSAEEKKRIKEVGEKIIACLQEFKVTADLVGYTPGPVITQYEIRPHPGVRVSKIKNLGDDLALKLEAISVRVQAPIPETDLIGIEVPNKQRQIVYFQELINSKAFENQQSLLTMALGKTTAGHPFFADLAQMPHLLIAGSTGAGKSVCLNSIILSILYKASPKEVQFLLIDPKRVELQAYQNLPHLVHPVVTQMDLARSALQWAVEEMERRYSSMERMGSKDIIDYNAKIRRILASHAERADVLQEFPYLVILIDELADLILTATKEVETNLTRLSQLARACGIHLIIATQRPSVDVVTALIKANFPSRIAFRVTSRHDSGTILDTVGAEKLLGKGDMLFKTTQVQRIHGVYVSSDEIDAVVDYWKKREKPVYAVDFAQWQNEKTMQSSSVGIFADENDPQYQEAVKFVYEKGEASISAIQRRFRIGFNKAARYVEQMEQNGILENVGGTKRKVVRNI